MRTLPREPWRGGQICGEQIGYGLPHSIFCGEFKKLGSPACEEHDRELREDNYGVVPKFAKGNALGLELTFCSVSWVVRDGDGVLIDAHQSRAALQSKHGFMLCWEPYEGDTPIPADDDELAAFQAQLKDANA